jgi:hypothetical protein
MRRVCRGLHVYEYAAAAYGKFHVDIVLKDVSRAIVVMKHLGNNEREKF